MILEHYEINLYCDCDDCPQDEHTWQGQFTGRTRGVCVKRIRRAGWLMKRTTDRALCPTCRKKRCKNFKDW